jgi:hypothetical protein
MSVFDSENPDEDFAEEFLRQVSERRLGSEIRTELNISAENARFAAAPICVECGEPSIPGRLYCDSGVCSDIGKAVRYIRGAIADGRIDREDVVYAVGIKLLSVLSGGYDAAGRSLSDKQRIAIFERDKGICQICGTEGNRIDHIEGSSDDPSNLRILCEDCNRKLPFGHAAASEEEISDKDKAFQEATWENMVNRVAATNPMQLSDLPDWKAISIKLRAARRKSATA